jgi:hypothetical protein
MTLADIYDYERRRLERLRALVFGKLPDGVTGSPEACYLVVGEQVSGLTHGQEIPFHRIDHSSRYLMDALDKVPTIHPYLFAFTNAILPGGKVTDEHRHRRKYTSQRDLKAVVEGLPNFKRAIALGTIAARVCTRQEVAYRAVPHPSFWKRFKYHDLEGYVKLLEEAMND